MLSKFRKKSQQGFTLVELMIVVAIIGILAVVAIPTYLRFTRQAKTAEVTINLAAISKGATGWYNDEHTDTSTGNPVVRHFPNGVALLGTTSDGTAGLTLASAGVWTEPATDGYVGAQPSTIDPCTNGQAIYTKDLNRWQGLIWTRLQFGIDKSHYFQYSYQTGGTGSASRYLLVARADIDCDKTFSDYRMYGSVNATTGEIERSNIIKKDPLE